MRGVGPSSLGRHRRCLTGGAWRVAVAGLRDVPDVFVVCSKQGLQVFNVVDDWSGLVFSDHDLNSFVGAVCRPYLLPIFQLVIYEKQVATIPFFLPSWLAKTISNLT